MIQVVEPSSLTLFDRRPNHSDDDFIDDMQDVDRVDHFDRSDWLVFVVTNWHWHWTAPTRRHDTTQDESTETSQQTNDRDWHKFLDKTMSVFGLCSRQNGRKRLIDANQIINQWEKNDWSPNKKARKTIDNYYSDEQDDDCDDCDDGDGLASNQSDLLFSVCVSVCRWFAVWRIVSFSKRRPYDDDRWRMMDDGRLIFNFFPSNSRINISSSRSRLRAVRQLYQIGSNQTHLEKEINFWIISTFSLKIFDIFDRRQTTTADDWCHQ